MHTRLHGRHSITCRLVVVVVVVCVCVRVCVTPCEVVVVHTHHYDYTYHRECTHQHESASDTSMPIATTTPNASVTRLSFWFSVSARDRVVIRVLLKISDN